MMANWNIESVHYLGDQWSRNQALPSTKQLQLRSLFPDQVNIVYHLNQVERESRAKATGKKSYFISLRIRCKMHWRSAQFENKFSKRLCITLPPQSQICSASLPRPSSNVHRLSSQSMPYKLKSPNQYIACTAHSLHVPLHTCP